jgi:hypothetical protein
MIMVPGHPGVKPILRLKAQQENEFSNGTTVHAVAVVATRHRPAAKPVATEAVAIRIDLDQNASPEYGHLSGNNQMNPSAIGVLQTCREWPARPGDFAQNTLAPYGWTY